jgi:predicted ATPase
MAHLNFFGLENFRVFKDLQRFDLKPITILVGTNSSGKSSLTKGILLLEKGFKKIEVERKSSGRFDADSIKKLQFTEHLNLGNFENCTNNKNVDSKDKIIFELPLKFPFLPDLFAVQFLYEKKNNALKNGVLGEVKIVHLATGTEILSNNNSTGKLVVNLSFLQTELEVLIPSFEEIEKIERKIDGLLKDSASNISKQTQINELRYQIKKILVSYSYDFIWMTGTEDVNCFNTFHPIYSQNAVKPLDRYDPRLPLLNYSLLFKDEFIKKNKTALGLSEDDLKYIVEGNKAISAKFDSKGSLRAILREIEQDSLENMIAEIPDFETSFRSTFFSDRIHDFKSAKYVFYSKLSEASEIHKEMLKNEEMSNYMSINFGSDGELMEEKKTSLILKSDSKPHILPENLDYLLNDIFYTGIKNTFETLSGIYKSINYVPAVRTKVDRIFRNKLDSYLQEVLLTIHETSLNHVSIAFMNKYLKLFGIADGVEIDLAKDSSFSKIYLLKEKEKVELADLGYGVAQLLPIILKIAVLINSSEKWLDDSKIESKSTILIIEEPETNLHPALQSKLADMFVECFKKYKIQFIVETHSEYLIRKLQYLTAKGEFSPDDSNIYYFHDPNNIPEGEPQVKKIEILEDGSLSDDFGAGFYDEATNWKFELLQLRKSQKN